MQNIYSDSHMEYDSATMDTCNFKMAGYVTTPLHNNYLQKQIRMLWKCIWVTNVSLEFELCERRKMPCLWQDYLWRQEMSAHRAAPILCACVWLPRQLLFQEKKTTSSWNVPKVQSNNWRQPLKTFDWEVKISLRSSTRLLRTLALALLQAPIKNTFLSLKERFSRVKQTNLHSSRFYIFLTIEEHAFSALIEFIRFISIIVQWVGVKLQIMYFLCTIVS